MFRFFLRKFRKKKEKGWILDTFLEKKEKRKKHC